MKAVQIVAQRRAEVVDVDEPSLAGRSSGLIKVRLERACLCASDTPHFDYDHGDAYPLRPGLSIHECIGTVVETTSPNFEVGDFVLAWPEQPNGGLCEYIIANDNQSIHLQRNAAPLEQLVISQPLGTVIWACQKLGNMLDKDVVIIGQGPIGLMFSHMMSNLGARNIIALDRIDYRLEAACKMKATHAINIDREDPVEAVRKITGGKMADLTVEAAGHQSFLGDNNSIQMAINTTRRLGSLMVFGVPDEEINEYFPIREFFRQNLTLIGTVGPDMVPNFSLARDMIVQGRIDVTPLVTHVLPFQEIQEAYELFVDRKDGAIKVILDYDTLR